MPTTDQEDKGNNPEGKGGFQDHPEHRNPGGWKKVETFRYWFEKFKEMTGDEFTKWAIDNPEGKRTKAASLAYRRMVNSQEDLKEFQEVADRSEGKAPQTLIHEGGLFQETKLQITRVDDKPESEQQTGSDPETTG